MANQMELQNDENTGNNWQLKLKTTRDNSCGNAQRRCPCRCWCVVHVVDVACRGVAFRTSAVHSRSGLPCCCAAASGTAVAVAVVVGRQGCVTVPNCRNVFVAAAVTATGAV